MSLMSRLEEKNKRVHYISYDSSLPISVMEIGWEITKPNHTWTPNGRPRYLIHMIKRGKITVTRANGEIMHLGKGDSFINAPDEASTMRSDSDEGCEYYWLGFNGSYAKPFLEKTTKSLYPKYKESGIVAISELLESTVTDPIGTLCALFKVFNAIKDESHSEENDFVNKAILYVESNYHKSFNVEKYAKSIGVSRSYFTTSFTEKTGTSPYSFLINERIENAKKYLLKSDLTITQIATKVGFSSIDRFSSIFKEKTGMSPKKYRISIKILP